MVIKDRVNVKDRSMRTDQNSKHSSPPCNALQVIYESWQDSHTREVDAFVKRDPRIWQFIASAILLSLFGCGKSDQQQAPPPEVQVVQVEESMEMLRISPLLSVPLHVRVPALEQ